MNAGRGKDCRRAFCPHAQCSLFRHLLRHADGGAGGGAPSGGITDATSTEFGLAGTPVVGLMTEWAKGDVLEKRGITSDLGGTMRLGAYEAFLAEDLRVADIYGTRVIPSATATVMK